MTIKFEVELEIDQASITDEEVDAIINGLFEVIPGGFNYGDDEMIVVERTTISRTE